MGNKISANLYRLGVTKNWNSRWFGTVRNLPKDLQEDAKIRKFVTKTLSKSGISTIDIERSPRLINIIIHTSRAGMIIGKGGAGIEALKKNIKQLLGTQIDLRLTVEEIKNPNENAAIIGENIAEQLEKRIPFRRILKQTIENVYQSHNIKGVKILLSGRLDGAEMSRTEYLTKGKIPLATLRADIDFAKKTAYTKYGTTGIKVWIYKGDVVAEEN
ncbi:30S ribosomal protein S3 [bacterium]|nr:30S ribosomal protein S3 [Candidatus Elulimicrobium humile]